MVSRWVRQCAVVLGFVALGISAAWACKDCVFPMQDILGKWSLQGKEMTIKIDRLFFVTPNPLIRVQVWDRKNHRLLASGAAVEYEVIGDFKIRLTGINNEPMTVILSYTQKDDSMTMTLSCQTCSQTGLIPDLDPLQNLSGQLVRVVK